MDESQITITAKTNAESFTFTLTQKIVQSINEDSEFVAVKLEEMLLVYYEGLYLGVIKCVENKWKYSLSEINLINRSSDDKEFWYVKFLEQDNFLIIEYEIGVLILDSHFNVIYYIIKDFDDRVQICGRNKLKILSINERGEQEFSWLRK